MKGVVASKFGEPDEVLEMADNLDRPSIKPGSGDLLVEVLHAVGGFQNNEIKKDTEHERVLFLETTEQEKRTTCTCHTLSIQKVHAMSLSPGDWRMLSGQTDLVKKPKSWPYVPGHDVCGVVVDVDPELLEKFASSNKSEPTSEEKGNSSAVSQNPCFKKGDKIVGTWDLFGMGGIAEYCLVNYKLAALLPENVSFVDGAALANSASHALGGVKNSNIKEHSRVLVLGGSGAVGTCLIQLARLHGAKYIAATSTHIDLLQELGVDRPIDYKTENWWEIQEFIDEPFDVIFDCAEGQSAWQKARKSKVLKSGWNGGIFRAFIPREWLIEMHGALGFVGWFMPVIGRAMWSHTFSPFAAKWKMAIAPVNGETVTEVLQLAADKKLKVVIDPASPYPFTAQGAKDAFNKLLSRRAVGKLVIQIRDDGHSKDVNSDE